MNSKILIGAVVAAAVAGGAWYVLAPKGVPEATGVAGSEAAAPTDVLATNGLHWHVDLAVYVNGARQQVPSNIGVGAGYSGKPTYDARHGMAGMHTHDPDGEVHLEFAGRVTRDDTRLGTFFAIWGKSFADYGSRVIMKVNGKETDAGENYAMQDGDKIILSFFP